MALKFNHSQVPLYTESDLLRPKTDAPLGDSKAKPSLRSNASALDNLAFFRSVTILYNLASAQSIYRCSHFTAKDHFLIQIFLILGAYDGSKGSKRWLVTLAM